MSDEVKVKTSKMSNGDCRRLGLQGPGRVTSSHASGISTITYVGPFGFVCPIPRGCLLLTLKMEYLVRFVQYHGSFRKPELEALASLADIDLKILDYSEYVC